MRRFALGWFLRWHPQPKLCPAIVLLPLILLTTAGANGQSPPHDTDATSQAKQLVFRSFSEHAGNGKIQLANGITVDPKDWRTLLNAVVGEQALSDGSVNPMTCSATLIGRGVFLTSAHCFDDGPNSSLTQALLNIGGQPIAAICSISDEYHRAVQQHIWKFSLPRVSEDYALCQFTMPAVIPSALNAIEYEDLDTNTVLDGGAAVLMTGYGCTSISIDAEKRVVAREFDDKLRIGDAKIAVAASEGAQYSGEFATIWSATNSQPALCPGDSGAPLFSGATADNQRAPRRVRGTNSYVVAETDQDNNWRIVSKIAPLATSAFRRFVLDWIRINSGKTICGVNAAIGEPPCRG